MTDSHYDVRNSDFQRIERLDVRQCSSLAGAGFVWGKVNADGRLTEFVAMVPAGKIRKYLSSAGSSGRVSAEDNCTVVKDLPTTFSPHMARAKGYANSFKRVTELRKRVMA